MKYTEIPIKDMKVQTKDAESVRADALVSQHFRESLKNAYITTRQTENLKYQILFNGIPVGGKILNFNTARDIQLWLYRVKNNG